MRLFSDRILPLGPKDARIRGRLGQDLFHANAELMIAATALVHGAVVVTGNAEVFRPTGARLDNPF